jgi:transcriptional regulator with XRE-family HTH domain
MLVFMIDSSGRIRIGEFVKAAMGWQGLSGSRIEAGGRVSRATIDRVKRGDPKVSETMLRALGDTLGLPRDYLLYVGSGDVRKIEQSGAEADLIRVTIDLIHSAPGGNMELEGRE